MTSTGKTSAEVLADFVYRTNFSDLSDAAIKMSRRMILDQLGGELASSTLDWNKKVLKYVEDLAIASDQAVIVNYGVRSCAEYAAFANATFGHGFELDDFAPDATAHPGCVAVPAAMSVGEREHLSGEDLLTGVALASEVITRVGEAGMKWMLARGFHETCTLGVFGASAVAAKMLGMDPEHITNAMSIAGSHASGTIEFTQTGGDVKRVHAGLGANGGIRSALLARNGLTGPPTILEGERGVPQSFGGKFEAEKLTRRLGDYYAFLTNGGIRSALLARNGLTGPPTILEGERGVLQSFGGKFEAEKLTRRLGDYYAFLANGFKPYCCVIDIHSPIDALTRVITAHDLGPQDIAEITVPLAHTLKLHSGTVGPEPHDITEAQLSQHYSLALTVCKRSNSFSTYIDALRSGFKDSDVLAVARKVSIAEFPDPPGSDRTPIPGQVKSPPLTVQTAAGNTYAEDLRPSKGSPQNPMTDEELEDKFMSLATRVMPQEQASKIAATVRDLENVKDLRDLTDLLVSPSS